MQKISEILNSPTAPAETGARASSRPTTSDAGNWIWSNDERLAGRPGVPEPVPCEFCGALRYHKGILLGNRILWPPYGAERCTCPEAVAAYEKAKAEREAAEAAAAKAEKEKKMRDRIKRIVGESGMGDRFLRRTFSTFQLTDDNKRAAAAARRYAEGFDAMLPQPGRQEPGRNGLFIAGPPGTGKTHLAAAIANHLIAQGKPVICMTMIDLLERIKRTYLDAFDHWLRDDRGLVYGRYMDDFYIIHSDKLLLRQILKEIEAYIKPLGLRLNGKTQILPLKNGIDFLGFHTYLTQTGKVVRKVRAKSIDNMKRKIRKFRGLVDSGKMTLDSVVQSYASWTGHISHGNTYHLRQNMDAYFFSYFPELKPSPKGDTTHGPKTEQPRKQVEGQVRQPVRQPDRLDRGR